VSFLGGLSEFQEDHADTEIPNMQPTAPFGPGKIGADQGEG